MRSKKKSSVTDDAMEQNMEDYQPRVFVSYSHEDKEIAASLKLQLEYAGMKAFLAHEDIEPGEEWKQAILKELDSCDLLVPLITSSAASSPYVNQEIGFALARRVTILPFKIDTNPFGFVSEKQGMAPPKTWRRVTEGVVEVIDFAKSAQVIADKIANKPELASRLRMSIINGLSDSKCFDETECRVARLEKYLDLRPEEIKAVARAAIKNRQVYDSYKAQKYMKKFVEKYEGDLLEELRVQIKSRYGI